MIWDDMTLSLRKLISRSGSRPSVAADNPLIAVFGGSSAQGISVIHSLLESGKYHVRAVTRNADSEESAHLKEAKVDVVHANPMKKDELKQALQGVYGLYIVMDFYAVNFHQFDLWKNVVESAKEAGVQHVIVTTRPNLEKHCKGNLSVPHFTSKAKVEDLVSSLGFRHHTFVMCAFSFQHFGQLGLAKAGADGSVVFELPIAENAMLKGFDVDDTGAAVLDAFEHPENWHAKFICLSGYQAPVRTYVEDFEAVTGRKAVFRRIPQDEAEAWTEMFHWFTEYTCHGLHDASASGANTHLKNWKEWLRSSGWNGPEAQKQH